MSKPALRGRLGATITYPPVWEYTGNFLFVAYKKGCAHQRHRVCFLLDLPFDQPSLLPQRQEADSMKREWQDQGERLKPLKYKEKV